MNAIAPTLAQQSFLIRTINALIDGGHLAQLKGLELAVLMVYLRRADASGVAFPGPTSIAKLIGHRNVNHVCTARKRLVWKGFLQLVKTSDEQGRTWYRVSIPDQSQRRTSPKSGLVPDRDYGQSQIGTSGSPESGQKVVPNRDVEDSKRRLTLNNSMNNTLPAVAGEDELGVKKLVASKSRKKAKPVVADSDVERVWKPYPKKEGAQEGKEAIAKALVRIRARHDAPADPVAWLVARVEAYAVTRIGEPDKYTKMAQGWFNKSRYDDDLGVTQAGGGPDLPWNEKGEFKETVDVSKLVIETCPSER